MADEIIVWAPTLAALQALQSADPFVERATTQLASAGRAYDLASRSSSSSSAGATAAAQKQSIQSLVAADRAVRFAANAIGYAPGIAWVSNLIPSTIAARIAEVIAQPGATDEPFVKSTLVPMQASLAPVLNPPTPIDPVAGPRAALVAALALANEAIQFAAFT